MLIALSPILIEWKNRKRNEKIILKRIETAIQRKADVICFPEYCLTGYDYSFDKESALQAIDIYSDHFIDEVRTITANQNIDIILGCLEKDKNAVFNSSLYISKGELLEKYQKIMEGGPISKGNKVSCFDTKLGRVSMIICGDIFHDFVISELSKHKPDIVFMPMDRCLGEMDFCNNFKSNCDKLDCTKEDKTHKCYEKKYSDHNEAWNKRAKLDYCHQVKKYNATTIIVNGLDHNHEAACGGALFINNKGIIIDEINYGCDNIKYITLEA